MSVVLVTWWLMYSANGSDVIQYDGPHKSRGDCYLARRALPDSHEPLGCWEETNVHRLVTPERGRWPGISAGRALRRSDKWLGQLFPRPAPLGVATQSGEEANRLNE